MSLITGNREMSSNSGRRNLKGIFLHRLSDYWVLTKPEVNFLVVMSTLAGFYIALRGPLDFLLLFNTLLGTLLVASGTGTLNQYMSAGPMVLCGERRAARCLLAASTPLRRLFSGFCWPSGAAGCFGRKSIRWRACWRC